MAITEVSEAFAFVLENASFSDSILFSEDEIPELRPDEQRAIDQVLKHVEESYITLLSACREQICKQAPKPFSATVRKLWNRDKLVWDRGFVCVPLVVQGTSNISLAVEVGLWAGEGDPTCIRLHAYFWSRSKLFDKLSEAVRSVSKTEPQSIENYPNSHRVLSRSLKKGETFADIATSVATDLWAIGKEIKL